MRIADRTRTKGIIDMTFVNFGDKDFEYVKVLPYVGRKYTEANRWGVSTLVLGEAHYLGACRR